MSSKPKKPHPTTTVKQLHACRKCGNPACRTTLVFRRDKKTDKIVSKKFLKDCEKSDDE